jgi:hypothetical protein
MVLQKVNARLINDWRVRVVGYHGPPAIDLKPKERSRTP